MLSIENAGNADVFFMLGLPSKNTPIALWPHFPESPISECFLSTFFNSYTLAISATPMISITPQTISFGPEFSIKLQNHYPTTCWTPFLPECPTSFSNLVRTKAKPMPSPHPHLLLLLYWPALSSSCSHHPASGTIFKYQLNLSISLHSSPPSGLGNFWSLLLW